MFNQGMPWEFDDLPLLSGGMTDSIPASDAPARRGKGNRFMAFATPADGEFVPLQWQPVSQKKALEEARADGSDLSKEAAERLMALEKDAYGKGLVEGRAEAYRKEQERIEAALQGLMRVTRELCAMKKDILEEAEEEILELALAIGKQAVLEEININRELVINAVRAAVKKVESNGGLKVRVNPSDIALVQEHRPELVRFMEGKGEVTVIKDDKVPRGGCIVETQHQVVEYDPNQQVEAIGVALRKRALDTKGQNVPL